MLSILHEKEIYNKNLKNRYMFFELKLNYEKSRTLNNIISIQDFLQRKLETLKNVDYDKVCRITAFSEDNLMIYLVTELPKKRDWEKFIRSMLEQENVTVREFNNLGLFPTNVTIN